MLFKPKKETQDKETQTTAQSNLDTEQSGDKKGFNLFKKLNPKQQRLARFAIIILGIALISYLTVISTPQKKETKKEPTPAEKRKYSLLTEKVDKDLWISAEGENIAQLKKQVESLEGRLSAIDKSIEALREDIKKKTTENLQQVPGKGKPGDQKQGQGSVKGGFPPIPPELNPFNVPTSASGGKPQPQESSGSISQPQQVEVCDEKTGQCKMEPLPPPVPIGKQQPQRGKPQERVDTKKFRIFENELKEEKKESAKKQTKEKLKTVWIPAGTMIKATLLTGMDAPTDVGAAKEPLPVVMLVSDIAMMPNQFGLDLRQCIIIGSGWGNLADERAYIRTDVLSCITREGKAFEIGLKGHVYSSEDGKSGLRGRYVSKQGQQIAMALLSGLLSSVGQSLTSLQGNVVNVYTDDNNKNRRISLGSALGAAAEQSLFAGVGSATRSVADFYLKLADKMYPVIEIDAGRKVEILVLKGQEVKIKQN